MNISTELLIGIILIVMGLLLGGAAYLVLSTRGEETTDSEEEPPEDVSETAEDSEEEPFEAEIDSEEVEEPIDFDPASTDSGMTSPPDEEFHEAADDLDQALEGDSEIPIELKEPAGVDFVPEEEEPQEYEQPQPEPDPEPEPMQPITPEPGPQIQVATLLRDDVTGELIVRVGDRNYHSADELRVSKDWTRVEFAASDLSKWIDQPVSRPAPEREVEPVDRGQPKSMIEQINEILQEKIEASGKSHLAVRLIEGQEGTARVLIGVHSYELGEVPDESISELIREAVADWEAGA